MSHLLSNPLVTIYMVLSLIQDQSQLSSFIRLEMASMNAWVGQPVHVEIANFPWIWPQMSILLEVKKIALAILKQKDNKVVKYSLSENDLFLFPHPIVFL